MNKQPKERCIDCDGATGMAGPGDDSLYCEHCRAGPFYWLCY